MATVVDGELWIGLFGRPFRLLPGTLVMLGRLTQVDAEASWAVLAAKVAAPE